jgi:hypothetical protein
MISSDEVDRVFERIFMAAKLDVPGMGFMYATPLLQAATMFHPQFCLSTLVNNNVFTNI